MRGDLSRTILAAIVAELLAIGALLLVIPVVIASDPLSYGQAENLGRRLANWVLPVAGFGTCLLAAWWVARKLSAHHLRFGVLVGVAAAMLDMAFLISLGAPPRAVLVVSELGRVAGGIVGAWWVSASRARRRQPS
jgi:hypothetical protein